MKRPFITGLALLAGLFHLNAQGTAFTYQGRLNNNGSPATGTYDFRFKLYFDDQGNTQAGTAYATNGLAVSDGLFVTAVDFGPGLFAGSNYWLEVDVRTNSTADYTVLSPLQGITPVPYAVFAAGASNLTGSLPARQVSGTLANGNLPASPTFTGSVSATAFTGNGASVTNVNAASLNGLTAGNFWQLGGNNVASGQFVGSTNFQPVETWVNNTRALRLEPTTNDASHSGLVNVIGGSPANRIAPGTYGSVIAGGGSSNYTIYGPGAGNTLASDLSFLGGGEWNAIQTNAIFSLLGGGNGNTIQSGSTFSVLAGGYENVLTNSSYAFLGAGLQNQINNSTEGFIGGGVNNFIQGSPYAVIAGGDANSIYNNSSGASVLGGFVNIIQANSGQATIAGGGNNTIQSGSYNATISGGWNNTIGTNSAYGFVGGGMNNKLLYSFNGSQSAPYSVLVGGQYNVNGGTASFIGAGFGNSISNIVTDSFLGGGYQNTLWTYCSYDFLGGGANNVINSQVTYSFLGGGQGNVIQGSYTTLDSFLGAGWGNSLAAAQAVLGGGVSNSIATGAVGAVLAGGLTNFIGTNAVGAFVGGGMNNAATTNYAVVAGGANNTAAGLYSLAAGQNARALFAGDFVWADSQTTNFTASANDQFLIRARGGVGINRTNPASALDVNGNVNASTFSGNGSGLTGLTATNLTGIIPVSALPASVVINYGSGYGSLALAGVASGEYSVSFGPEDFATGYSSTALGYATEAGGGGSTAFGYSTSAAGTVATAMGEYTFADGYAATALGQFTFAGGDNSLAGGVFSQATNVNAIALGTNTLAGGYAAVALGNNTIANGNNATALGTNAVADGYAAVAMGNSTTASGDNSTALGDYTTASGLSSVAIGQNTAASGFAAVALGIGTKASNLGSTALGTVTTASGSGATALGALTVASGNSSTALGSGSLAQGDYSLAEGNNSQATKASSVALGTNAFATGYAAVAIGDNVTASGDNSVALGSATLASGQYSTAMGFKTTATNWYDTALGNNTIAGGGSSTAMGFETVASGTAATAMGNYTTASGYASTALGAFASATHDLSFVWSDGSDDFSSTADEQFSVLASGGVRFVTGTDGSGNPSSGVTLAPGGAAWATISDQNAKKNFQAVNGEEVLAKLAAVPVEKWNYKWEKDSDVPNIGPMAQAFKKAFYPGRDDKSITTLEFDGVELAAIQGLNEKLETENAALKTRLAKLEMLVEKLAQAGGAK